MDYATQRHNMVENQVRPCQVSDSRILDAMLDLPRENFLPDAVKNIAYTDEALPIGANRYAMEPLVVGRLVQAVEIASDDMVLVIGAADAYTTAVVSRLAATVVALESNAELMATANARLTKAGIDNVAVVEGTGLEGYPRQAPYDAIVFAGAVTSVPSGVIDQLADGGRLVAVHENASGVGQAVLMRRAGDVVSEQNVFETGTPTLPEFVQERHFEF